MWKGLAALFFVVWTALFNTYVLAQSNIQLINKVDAIRLSDTMKVFYEADAPMTIDDIRKQKDKFTWHTSSNPNYGVVEKALWLHSSFSNVSDEEEWVIDIGFAHLDKVDIYILDQKTILVEERQGKLSQTQQYRFPTVKVDLPLARTIDLYIRIETKSSQAIAPVDIQPYSHFMRANFWDNLLWGLFYGGLIILAIYNAVLWFGTREISLLAYVGYIKAVLVWQFVWGGHSIMLLPHAFTLWLGSHTDLIFVLIGIASGIFTYTFLEAKSTAPKTAPFIKTNIGVLAVMGFCSMLNLLPTLWQNTLVYLVSLFAISSYLIAGFESYLNRFRPARYFIFAWTILALSALIGMLSLVDILPTNSFTSYCFQVGVFIEAGLFSLAIMDKSRNQLERDIQQATNDLRTNMEFIEEQNARLDIARKDAIAASNIKSQFLANMSHEIRTPLNAILGFSGELQQLPLPIEKQEHVRIINSAADSLLSIINDVLDVSKIEAGKLEIVNEPFSPYDVIEEMVSVMAKSAHLKGLEFVFDLSPLPAQLIGDPQRIKQILTNLLGNALKFTHKGYIRISIAGKAMDNGLFEVIIVVEDTGIGISQKDRKKLFNAFTQIDDDTSRSYPGTGLGLVISQQLVRLMGGRIALSSTPGKGSQFTVSIITNLLNSNTDIAQRLEWNNKNVIMLSTDQVATDSTQKILHMAGSNVRLVGGITELLEQHHKYDAIFVCLPHHYTTEYPQRIASLRRVLCDDIKSEVVVLFSGQDTIFSPTQCDAPNVKQLRLPLTFEKLRSLSQGDLLPNKPPEKKPLESLPALNVLAVDDMEMNLRLLKTWFKPSKLALTLSYTGADAVEQCKHNEFDIILMDVQMPTMDGLQASRLIRKTKLNIGTPIIAVTAHALREEQDRLLASGMDDYLPKPIDLNDLVALIRRWCVNDFSDEIAEQHDRNDDKDSPIDWQLSLKLANMNSEIAQELLTAFVEQLPLLASQIRFAWQAHDLTLLKDIIHKLHGASCYTGVPALRTICHDTETVLKQADETQLEALMPKLFAEIDAILSTSEDLIADIEFAKR